MQHAVPLAECHNIVSAHNCVYIVRVENLKKTVGMVSLLMEPCGLTVHLHIE